MMATAERPTGMEAIDVLLDQIRAAIEEVRELASHMETPPDDRPSDD